MESNCVNLGFVAHAKEPENGFFFVAAVAAGVDADGRQFASFAPSFNSQNGNPENLGDFFDGQKIG